MEFGDILRKSGIDPKGVLILRHSPPEAELRKVLPWLANEHPDVFNTYQSTQHPRAEAAMTKAKHVASFIGHGPGKALFVGLYEQAGSKLITDVDFRALEAVQLLTDLGQSPDPDPAKHRSEYQHFDLRLTGALSEWSGRLIVNWPPPEIGWFKWASKSTFPIHAITEDSLLVKQIPHWKDVSLTCDALKVCPEAWRAELRRWRGIYFIFDTAQAKGYVGSAYGDENIWQRWSTHAKRGGDAKKLKHCDPRNFVFTILEVTNHEMTVDEIVKIEINWTLRLHTIAHGLNDN